MFVESDSNRPPFIDTLETLVGIYTYDEIIEIMSTDVWTKNDLL